MWYTIYYTIYSIYYIIEQPGVAAQREAAYSFYFLIFI